MPIYEYRRPDGTTFDVLQKFSDDALTTDPETGVPVERVLSAPSIHFKGSGFHNTDYGTKKRPVGGDSSSSSSSESKQSSTSADSSTGSSTSTSTDSKASSTSAPAATSSSSSSGSSSAASSTS